MRIHSSLAVAHYDILPAAHVVVSHHACGQRGHARVGCIHILDERMKYIWMRGDYLPGKSAIYSMIKITDKSN